MQLLAHLIAPAAALLLATTGVAAAGSDVIDLIPSNFDKIVLQSKRPALVEFFAPWCGHCKNLAPEWEKLGTAFAGSKDKVSIAKVDADANKDLGKRFGVQGFPTLKWFDGTSDKPEDYNGGRDLDALAAFVTQKTGIKPKLAKPPPSSVQMLTDTTFSTAIGAERDVLVAFTAPWCGHCKKLAPTWESLAEDFAAEPTVVIAKVDAEAENSKGVTKAQGVTGYPTIKFFPKGSRDGETYSGGRDGQAFVSFLNDKAGTHRAVGGGLDAVAGTIASLDSIAAKFSGAASDAVGALVDDLNVAAASVSDVSTDYYVKVASKLRTAQDYGAKELARLEGILKKGNLAPAKRDDLTIRSNILRKFQGIVTGDTGKDEL